MPPELAKHVSPNPHHGGMNVEKTLLEDLTFLGRKRLLAQRNSSRSRHDNGAKFRL